MLASRIKNLFPILLSSVFFLLSIALMNTTIPIRFEMNGYTAYMTGAVSTAYYFGVFLGAVRTESVILQIGHIRSFSAFASFLSAMLILPIVFDHFAVWVVARFCAGISLAGMYVVVESWILAFSSNIDRGRNLSLYMVVIAGAMVGGPLLIKYGSPATAELFMFAAILVSFSVLVMSGTRSRVPEFSEPSALTFRELYRVSKTGLIGCFVSGFMISTFISFFPVAMKRLDFTNVNVGYITAISMSGALFLQYPIGILADRIDNRLMLYVTTGAAIIACSISLFAFNSFSVQSAILAFAVGASINVIYPISMAYAIAHVKAEDIVNLTQGLMVAYGLGAFIGPMPTSPLIDFFGANGLFLALLMMSLLFFVVMVIIQVRAPREAPYDHDYALLPTTTPVASELDPRAE